MSASSKIVYRALRQLDRAAKQSRTSAVKQYKQQAKQLAIANAAEAVRAQNGYLQSLVTLHHNATAPIDWQAMLDFPEPTPPVLTRTNEAAAVHRRTHYTPSFFARTFRLEGRQRKSLDSNIELGREKDADGYRKEKVRYEEDLAEWKANHEMAAGVLANNASVYIEVLEAFEPFAELAEFGSRLQFELESTYASVNLFINSEEIVPSEVLSQTSTGKLSRKAMSVSRGHSIYQEFVCSAVLRVAREMFACLPIPLVVVNTLSTLLDTSTGRSGEKVIVSVAFTRKIFEELDYEHLDPAASLRNFSYRMQFTKTGGFSPVDHIDPKTLLLK